MFREAVAGGEIRVQAATLKLIESQTVAKGNVLATARVAGIQAAKRTGDLIPLCHPLPITHCEVNFFAIACRSGDFGGLPIVLVAALWLLNC